jgi:4-amino-4-deoxy-L-arabinose transferase-like glycosyltransferase
VLALLLLITLVARAHQAAPPEVTGDATGKWWFARKAMHGHLVHKSGGEYWTHHMARASINIPAGLVQLLFGPTGRAYFVPALGASLLQTGFVFALATRLAGPLAGTLASLWIIFFPGTSRAGTQLMPGVFEAAYTVAAAYYLVRLCEDGLRWQRARLVALAWWLFGAYLAKITSVFLFPGVFVALFWFSPPPLRLKRVLWLAGMLLAAYLAETLWYAIFTQYRFGQIELTMGSYGHLGKLRPIRFLQLFSRYLALPFSWKLAFYAFFAVAIPILVLGRRNGLRAVVLTALSFLFGLTFYVRGINPLVQGTLNHPRYLLAVIPLLVVALTTLPFIALGPLVERRAGPALARTLAVYRRVVWPALTGALALGAMYYVVTRRSTPGLDQTRAWEKLVNQAYADGIPIVARTSGIRALGPTAHTLLRDRYMFDANGFPALPKRLEVGVGGGRYSYLSAPGVSAERVKRAVETKKCMVLMSIQRGGIFVSYADVRPACRNPELPDPKRAR